MIAMVGGMFFAAPQIASADNGDYDYTVPVSVVFVRDTVNKASITYTLLDNGVTLVAVRYDDGRTINFTM